MFAVKSCAVAPAPANGGRRGDVFTYGSVVSFYCNDGYALNGNTHLRCGATGQWNATLPSCTGGELAFSKIYILYCAFYVQFYVAARK